jgi:hypothetical protein
MALLDTRSQNGDTVTALKAMASNAAKKKGKAKL